MHECDITKKFVLIMYSKIDGISINAKNVEMFFEQENGSEKKKKKHRLDEHLIREVAIDSYLGDALQVRLALSFTMRNRPFLPTSFGLSQSPDGTTRRSR